MRTLLQLVGPAAIFLLAAYQTGNLATATWWYGLGAIAVWLFLTNWLPVQIVRQLEAEKITWEKLQHERSLTEARDGLAEVQDDLQSAEQEIARREVASNADNQAYRQELLKLDRELPRHGVAIRVDYNSRIAKIIVIEPVLVSSTLEGSKGDS